MNDSKSTKVIPERSADLIALLDALIPKDPQPPSIKSPEDHEQAALYMHAKAERRMVNKLKRLAEPGYVKCHNNVHEHAEQTYGSPKRASVIDAALKALHEREGTYGPVEEHHTRTAAVVSALLGMKFKPEWVSIFFIADKLARHMHSHHIDNLVDICGYAECQNRVHQHREGQRHDDGGKPEPDRGA